MICNRCGHELKEGEKFCIMCGAPAPEVQGQNDFQGGPQGDFQNGAPVLDSVPEKEGGRYRAKTLPIVLAIGITGAVIIIGLFFAVFAAGRKAVTKMKNTPSYQTEKNKQEQEEKEWEEFFEENFGGGNYPGQDDGDEWDVFF